MGLRILVGIVFLISIHSAQAFSAAAKDRVQKGLQAKANNLVNMTLKYLEKYKTRIHEKDKELGICYIVTHEQKFLEYINLTLKSKQPVRQPKECQLSSLGMSEITNRIQSKIDNSGQKLRMVGPQTSGPHACHVRMYMNVLVDENSDGEDLIIETYSTMLKYEPLKEWPLVLPEKRNFSSKAHTKVKDCVKQAQNENLLEPVGTGNVAGTSVSEQNGAGTE